MNTQAPQTIPVGAIRPNPQQPRQVFDEARLKALADSIRTVGLLQPIKVAPAPEGDGYTLVDDGERRLRAVRDILGWRELKVGEHVVIVDALPDEPQRLVRAVAANLERDDLDPIEIARALQRLSDQGLTDAQIAKSLGKSRPWVANKRRLLKLPEEVQARVAAGEVPERQARALLGYLRHLPPDAATPKEIEQALSSVQSSQPEQAAARLLYYRGKALPWPAAWKVDGKACEACPYYAKIRKPWNEDEVLHLCLEKDACYQARGKAWARHEARRVSRETGIPLLAKGESAYIGRQFTRQEEAWLRVVQETRSRGEPPPSVFRLVGVWENPETPVVHLAVTEPTAEVGVVRTTKVDWQDGETVKKVFFRFLVTHGVWEAILKAAREGVACAPWLRVLIRSHYIPGSTLYLLEEAGLEIEATPEKIKTRDPALHIALYLLNWATLPRPSGADTKADAWQMIVEAFVKRLAEAGLPLPIQVWPSWEDVAPPELVEDEARVVSVDGARSLRQVTAVEDGLAALA